MQRVKSYEDLKSWLVEELWDEIKHVRFLIRVLVDHPEMQESLIKAEYQIHSEMIERGLV